MNLNNLKTNDNIKLDSDYTGRRLLDSDAYPGVIELAYLTQAKSEALALNIVFKAEDGGSVSAQFWMTSGKAKGCKNTYQDAQGNEQYLPGFVMANSLALLTAAENIGDLETEEKVINLYDPTEKKELPTKVQMFTAMCGKEIIAGVQKQLVDKTAKNDAGKYVPTGETRQVNEIVKFFRHRDSMTVTEITSQAEEAAYIHIWTDQNKGQVIDKSSGEKAATNGAPAGSGAKKPASKTSSLFN